MKADDFQLDTFDYTVFDAFGDVVAQHDLHDCPRWVVKLLRELLDILSTSSECDIDTRWS